MKLAQTSLSLSLVAAALLLIAPSSATAAPVALGMGFLNSALIFGGPTFSDEGYDNHALFLYDVDLLDEWSSDYTIFSASGGTLVQETPVFDGGGTLIRTDYRYEGGLFRVEFVLDNGSEVRIGTFTAPIVALMISASEPLEPFVSNVDASYQLGPGLFDAAFANAFGIPKKTGAGFMDESLIFLEGDHTSPELIAENGGGSLDVAAPSSVPETPQTVLLGLGLLGALATRMLKQRV